MVTTGKRKPRVAQLDLSAARHLARPPGGADQFRETRAGELAPAVQRRAGVYVDIAPLAAGEKLPLSPSVHESATCFRPRP